MSEGKQYLPCPDNIAIIGGGRWARVLTEVLCEIVPPYVKLSLYSLHNIESISVWARTKGLDERIQLLSELPQSLNGSSTAVIVVNAARDHEAAVVWAISAGFPVLVEKPIALTSASSQRLADMALRNNVCIAAAHVFLFASYLDKFAKVVSDAGNIKALKVHWTDPRNEKRYGEQKQYDSSLPIYADSMPHVLSIIGTLLPDLPYKCELKRLLRGGAFLEIELMFGDTPCHICLERNSDDRRRFIEATVESKTIRLDFSKEPGIISDGAVSMVGDPDWDRRQRPVAQMLTAFLKLVVSGEYDSRLNMGIGLRACQVIDKISDKYGSAMKPWLLDRLSSNRAIDDDIRYALHEMLQSEGRLLPSIVDKQIESIWQQFSGVERARLLTELYEAQKPIDVFKNLAAINDNHITLKGVL